LAINVYYYRTAAAYREWQIYEKEWHMFQVTEKANEMIKAFLKERNLDSAIRILMAGGG
jgi:hypothetical protein